jgi:hypothetical protein
MSGYVPKGQESAINYESRYVTKKEINQVPTIERQAPNRKGNQSMKPANSFGGRQGTSGVTNPAPDTAPKVSQPKGAQGAPAVCKPLYNNSNLVGGNKCNAQAVSRPKNEYGNNDGYRAGSSYLK